MAGLSGFDDWLDNYGNPGTGDSMELTSGEMTEDIARMIADEIGDRLHNNNDDEGFPEFVNSKVFDDGHGCEFTFADGRTAIITVNVA
jgi:hypothetical protein